MRWFKSTLSSHDFYKAKVIFIEEIWKNYIYNYDVSNLGRLKNSKTGNILKVRPINNHDYLGTVVTLGSKKYIKMIIVHRAVAEMFIPNPENKPEVNHIDGNKTNNCVSNLEWTTRKENINHAIIAGLVNHKGENNSQAKLSSESVKYIREHYIPYDKNFSLNALAKKFGVTKQAIIDVVHYRSWKNVA